MTDDRMLARIAALLRQAEGTDNAHEAEAFMAAAQRLATMTSIDLAVARAHAATRTGAQTPTQRTITIGEPGEHPVIGHGATLRQGGDSSVDPIARAVGLSPARNPSTPMRQTPCAKH